MGLNVTRILDVLIVTAVNLLILGALFTVFIFRSPVTPLPDQYNPFRPFDPLQPVTFATRFKFEQIIQNEFSCQIALQQLNVTFEKREDFVIEGNEQCGIPHRTFVTAFDGVAIGPIETQCHVALRMALWTRDVAAPAAFELFRDPLTEITTQGSYNCRTIRTDEGEGQSMSEHATANAIDISGVKLESGREITVLSGWDGFSDEKELIRRLHRGGCNVFRGALGPDFNSAHNDHFHFDAGVFRICR